MYENTPRPIRIMVMMPKHKDALREIFNDLRFISASSG
ncbi:Unknown protein sequence [Pseudomonas coronafaciens pv. oryzae]|nr:Unknown protein sequence [Pseudomonas coronafaciens pv. oryzae]